ncbi:GntR family transcriptional regulator [Pseudomonas sp.]|uniref:GntR family transcriptional regulator n=1 Tax=Pseudomonas sp. TaxID=306 RepID=UPI0035686FF7
MNKMLSEAVRDEIEELIAFGKLPPGKHLDETELAERFGVSRTPVREALNQLANAGLVEIRPRRGAVVAEVGAQKLVEMFEVMAELEGMCGRLAARRISREQEHALVAAQEACEAIRDSGDPDLYYERNDEFHGIIYAASHNAFLVEQAWVLRRRLRPYRRLQLRARDRINNSLSEHEAIVRAIQTGDADQANELLREHVIIQGKRFGDLIATLPLLHAEAD